MALVPSAVVVLSFVSVDLVLSIVLLMSCVSVALVRSVVVMFIYKCGFST